MIINLSEQKQYCISVTRILPIVQANRWWPVTLHWINGGMSASLRVMLVIPGYVFLPHPFSIFSVYERSGRAPFYKEGPPPPWRELTQVKLARNVATSLPDLLTVPAQGVEGTASTNQQACKDIRQEGFTSAHLHLSLRREGSILAI